MGARWCIEHLDGKRWVQLGTDEFDSSEAAKAFIAEQLAKPDTTWEPNNDHNYRVTTVVAK